MTWLAGVEAENPRPSGAAEPIEPCRAQWCEGCPFGVTLQAATAA